MLKKPANNIKGITPNPTKAIRHSNMKAIMNDTIIVVVFLIIIAKSNVVNPLTKCESIESLLDKTEPLFLGRSNQDMGIFNIF
jgi:hypothetical protein